MKIARYLARETDKTTDSDGVTYALVSWAGSSVSIHHAREQALAKLHIWKERLNSQQSPGEYYTDNGDIREQLIQEVSHAGEELTLAVTRNHYGALVLNSAQVLFADVDVPGKALSLPGNRLAQFARLFRSRRKAREEEQQARDEMHAKYVSRFESFHRNHPHIAFRVYRTFAGYRILVTNQSYEAGSHEATAVLEALGSDPMYIKLCRIQQCFRARLTPKPWRCGLTGAPGKHPRNSEKEAEFVRWEKRYRSALANVSVCRLISTYGPKSTTDEASLVVDLHDRHVLSNSEELA